MSSGIAAYHSASTSEIRQYLFAISQYCRAVSDLTDEDDTPTIFYSTEEPAIDLASYIIGIGRRQHLCRCTALIASVYVSRVAQRTNRMPSVLSVHRLFASALLFACKTLRHNVPTNEDFAIDAGIPAWEVKLLQGELHRIIGHDASDYEADVTRMHKLLHAARRWVLRSDIAVAVAHAFSVPPPVPRLPPVRAVAVLSELSFGSTTPPFTSPDSSPVCAQRSNDSMFGSGLAAVRGLRNTSSCDSDASPSFALLLPPSAQDDRPWSGEPLLTFAVQFPRTLQEALLVVGDTLRIAALSQSS